MSEWNGELSEKTISVASVPGDGGQLRVGDRVRLRPRARGDILDIALAGQTALVEAIEQDYEGVVHLAVVLDDDPGRDLGFMRQPGHRFFFAPGEVECLDQALRPPAPEVSGRLDILVAGIGNLFLGDDGFGVEVAQRLARRELPQGVRVVDFGIRGFDLACALVDGPDVSILVDACPRGAEAGTVSLIEPDLTALASPRFEAAVEPHGLDPLSVLGLARRMGGALKTVLVVGCEPQTLGNDDGLIGLSEPVEAGVDRAIEMIESLIARIHSGEWSLPGSRG